MTAPVTVTQADYDLLRAMNLPASADDLLIVAANRTAAEAASAGMVAELVEALRIADERLFDATHAIESVPDKEFGFYMIDAPETAEGFVRIPLRQELLSNIYRARDTANAALARAKATEGEG